MSLTLKVLYPGKSSNNESTSRSSCSHQYMMLFRRIIEYTQLVNAECSQFPQLHPTKSCPYPGLLVEIIGFLAKSINATIEPLTMLKFGFATNEAVS